MHINPEDKSTFISTFFGPLPLPAFAALLLLALLTTAAMLMRSGLKRDPLSVRTPIQFDWKFFIYDTARRIFAGVLLVFLGIRFLPQHLPDAWQPLAALVIGWGGDRLAKLFDAITDEGFSVITDKFKRKP